MYEKKQGAERLIYALYNRKDDIETVARLAVTLDYVPSQLHEDIQALHDYLEKLQHKEGGCNNGSEEDF